MHDPHPVTLGSTCRNCAAALSGPYCAQCGQHAHHSAQTLGALLHEVWHLMTHLDGRLWNTLASLLLRPGRLTLEYFADHRARYVPPFQLYFVISVAFFGLASILASEAVVHTPRAPLLSSAERADLQRQLHESGAPAAIDTTVDSLTEHTMTPQVGEQLCIRVAHRMHWAPGRFEAVCKRQVADQGKTMMHTFGSWVPKMMFVFLPLMALIMLALYHTPRRYYVEHLVFLLHLQSVLFLDIGLGVAISQAADHWSALASIASVASMVLFWYAVWYSYAALRVFYGQSWTRTLVKFGAIAVAYGVCIALALTITLVLSAMLS